MAKLLLHTRRHDIVFNRSGRIDIMARISRALAIRKGDVINVDMQGGEPLLIVSTRAEQAVGRHAGQCYYTHKGGHNCRAYSKPICRAILDLCGGVTSARLCCGQPITLADDTIAIPIIYKQQL